MKQEIFFKLPRTPTFWFVLAEIFSMYLLTSKGNGETIFQNFDPNSKSQKKKKKRTNLCHRTNLYQWLELSSLSMARTEHLNAYTLWQRSNQEHHMLSGGQRSLYRQ